MRFLMRDVPIPIAYLVPALLLAAVPLGPANFDRSRLVGLLLLIGLLIGGHLRNPELHGLVTARRPYAVFFWSMITIITSLAAIAFLEWSGWLIRIAQAFQG